MKQESALAGERAELQSSIQAVQEAIAATSVRRAEFLAAIAGV